MALNYALHGGQSHACAREPFLLMESFKNSEELIIKRHIKSGTVILYKPRALAIDLADANFNLRMVFLRRIFQRIGD